MFKVYEFFYNLIGLNKYLTSLYSPKFKLKSISFSNDLSNCFVIFEDINLKKTREKSLSDLYNNHMLLNRFSSLDASEIGQSYGRLIAQNNRFL